MRNKRRVVSAAVIAAAAATTMLATATTASATPTNCTITTVNFNPASLCTGGTGHHRVDLVIFQANAGQNAVEGNWAAVGQYSTVSTSWTIVREWVELSNS